MFSIVCLFPFLSVHENLPIICFHLEVYCAFCLLYWFWLTGLLKTWFDRLSYCLHVIVKFDLKAVSNVQWQPCELGCVPHPSNLSLFLLNLSDLSLVGLVIWVLGYFMPPLPWFVPNLLITLLSASVMLSFCAIYVHIILVLSLPYFLSQCEMILSMFSFFPQTYTPHSRGWIIVSCIISVTSACLV